MSFHLRFTNDRQEPPFVLPLFGRQQKLCGNKVLTCLPFRREPPRKCSLARCMYEIPLEVGSAAYVAKCSFRGMFTLRDNTWHFSLVACLTHSFLLLVWICHRQENACRREDCYSHVSFCSPRSPVQQRKPTIYFCVGTKQLFSQTHKRSRSRDTVCTACKQPCASSKGILYRRGALEVRPEVRWL